MTDRTGSTVGRGPAGSHVPGPDGPEGPGSGRDDDGGPAPDNSLGRLLVLSDGVFAIAMTLLALDLTVPELGSHPTDGDLRAALFAHLPNFFSFVISFYVVANYWGKHRTCMRSVDTFHPALVRRTLLVLLVVAALPFPASLLGRYGGVLPFALVLYGAFNACATLLLLWLDHTVRARGLTVGGPSGGGERDIGPELWGDLSVFLLCIPASYVLGRFSPFVLALLLVSGWLSPVVFRRRRASPRS